MEEDLSFFTDDCSRIVSWGEQMGRIAGWQASKTVGKIYHSVFPKLMSCGSDAVSQALSVNEKITIRGVELRCPGQPMTADIIIDPVINGNGTKGARVTISRVICPALRGIGSAKRFVDIGRTASTLAHGVRNPLNAMKGAVLYLSGKYKDEPNLVEFARIMEDEITRFDRFIAKFLSSSVSDMEAVVTDINDLLRKIEVLISFQTRSSNINTICEYGDIPPVKVNSFHLEHAILNIINNSLEIMGSGGTLKIKTHTETGTEGTYIVIEISDTGPGTSGRTGRKGIILEDGGKGFGLLITREILRYYGGHLEVRNRRPKGTRALLYIQCGRKAATNNGQ